MDEDREDIIFGHCWVLALNYPGNFADFDIIQHNVKAIVLDEARDGAGDVWMARGRKDVGRDKFVAGGIGWRDRVSRRIH
jgi:hypothetical protein